MRTLIPWVPCVTCIKRIFIYAAYVNCVPNVFQMRTMRKQGVCHKCVPDAYQMCTRCVSCVTDAYQSVPNACQMCTRCSIRCTRRVPNMYQMRIMCSRCVSGAYQIRSKCVPDVYQSVNIVTSPLRDIRGKVGDDCVCFVNPTSNWCRSGVCCWSCSPNLSCLEAQIIRQLSFSSLADWSCWTLPFHSSGQNVHFCLHPHTPSEKQLQNQSKFEPQQSRQPTLSKTPEVQHLRLLQGENLMVPAWRATTAGRTTSKAIKNADGSWSKLYMRANSERGYSSVSPESWAAARSGKRPLAFRIIEYYIGPSAGPRFKQITFF